LRLQKELDRQIRNGRNYFYCSRSCSQSFNHTHHEKIMSKCLWCKNDFETTTHKKARKCCSIDCAVKYAQSKSDPYIHKQSVQRQKTFPKLREFICVMCGEKFSRIVKNNVEIRKTCSEKCYSKLVSQWSRNNPKCGGKLGYRRFPYRGYKMDSRWEVALAKWMDSEGIKWDRSRKRHMLIWVDENGDERKYFPDFYLPDLNIYLDPKNDYYLQRDLPKLKYVMNAYNVKIFYGDVGSIKKDIDKIRASVILPA